MKKIKYKLLIFVGMTVLIFSAILIIRTHVMVDSDIENLTHQELSLALNFNLAIREYVAETIRPLMFNLVAKGQFIPEAMSTSFVSRSIFEKVRKKFPNYIIKFASGDPRNPVNQAGPEELKMIQYFNDHPQDTNWAGRIKIDGKQYLATFSARRMRKACLRCHGNPSDAPMDLIKKYGSEASFYHPIGKVVGLDTIAIPNDIVKAYLLKENLINLGFLVGIVLLLCVSLVFIFKFIITDRLSKITNHFSEAEKQSGKIKIRSIEMKGRDEINILADSFNKLANKLNDTYIELNFEIEQRKQIQKALEESENRLHSVIDHAPIIIWATDQNGKFTFSKGLVFDRLGLNQEELVGRSVFDMYADNEQIISDTRRALAGERFSSVVEVEDIVFESRYTPLKDNHGFVRGMIGVAVDVTERKRALDALHESEERYRKLFELESDALALVDVETGSLIDVNRAFIELYGYSEEEIHCMIHTDFSADPEGTTNTVQNNVTYVPLRYHKKKNGVVFPVEITANYFEHKGRKAHIAAIRDITDRKIIEEQIQASLKEKELLLSEIHHRVKNNLEIISSLFNLSSINCENQEIKDLLFSSKTRIHSMAMIHSQLYQSERFDRIDMTKHVSDLVNHLLYLYESENKINFEIASSEIYLSINQAIPCALILNELITNSLKHAFKDRDQGKIQIFINELDNNTVLLRVKDDGAGIPEGVDVKSDGGFGLELVKHLAAGQLNGDIRFDNDEGTDICIEFVRSK